MQKRFTPDAGGVFPEWEEKTIEEACNVNVSNGTPGDKFIYIELGDVNKYGLLKRKNLVRKNEIFIFWEENGNFASSGYSARIKQSAITS